MHFLLPLKPEMNQREAESTKNNQREYNIQKGNTHSETKWNENPYKIIVFNDINKN